MKRIFRFGMIISVLIITLVITGCGKKNSPLVGTWVYYRDGQTRTDIYYQFNKDNTGKYSFYENDTPFTYEDNGNNVVIKYTKTSSNNNLEYSISKGVLTIKDSYGSNVTYKKK